MAALSVQLASEDKLNVAMRAAHAYQALHELNVSVDDLENIAKTSDRSAAALQKIQEKQREVSSRSSALLTLVAYDHHLDETVAGLQTLLDSYSHHLAQPQGDSPGEADLRLENQIDGIFRQVEHQEAATMAGELDSSNDTIYRLILICASLVYLELVLLMAGYNAVRRYIKRGGVDAEALRESEWFARSTVDALSAQIAILDSSGCILSVNRPWREFGSAGDSIIARTAEGTNYLAMCDTMAGQGREYAAALADGIRAVATGQKGEAYAEYHGAVGGETRWYMSRITRFPGNNKVRIVISH
ncbi:MAG TPA: hypothetical protein VKK61_05495, partial [Tepidisphaeraceae bacterium]|nr:hypothetical protein [Tepidisphaeraceae bacterium]